jgi:hypothetical protein
MNSAARSDLVLVRPRVALYPAPICGACNVAMPLASTFQRSDDPSSVRREYHCQQCGAVTKVRHTTDLRD